MHKKSKEYTFSFAHPINNQSGRTPFGDGKSSSSLTFEEFVPPSAWTEDSTCHYLLVDLPGFKRQELKLQVDNQTHIIVSGERQVRENKYKQFEQRFELPKDAEIEKITGKLDGEILYISVPKKVEQEHQEIKHGSTHAWEEDTSDLAPTQASAPAPAPPPPTSNVDEDEDGDDKEKKSDSSESDDNNGGKDVERKEHRKASDEHWGQEADLFLRLAIEKLKKNKGIVVTAILAFSLGVLVTQKFQSNGQ